MHFSDGISWTNLWGCRDEKSIVITMCGYLVSGPWYPRPVRLSRAEAFTCPRIDVLDSLGKGGILDFTWKHGGLLKDYISQAPLGQNMVESKQRWSSDLCMLENFLLFFFHLISGCMYPCMVETGSGFDPEKLWMEGAFIKKEVLMFLPHRIAILNLDAGL